MLDSVEVSALEKRWEKWRFKKIVSRVLLGLIIFCLIPLSWLIYEYLPLLITSPAPKVQPPKVVKPVETKPIIENAKVADNIAQNSNIPLIENQPIKEEEIYEYSTVKRAQKDQPVQDIYRHEPIEEIAPPEPVEEEYVQVEPEDEYIDVEPQKPSIDIQTSDMGGYSTLKDKFYGTNNIVYALMIAEEYYNDKDYKNSKKWALVANNIDSKNERSWVIFAKSMAKNGKPQKAIEALNAFLKTNPNATKISALIRKIKHGDF